MDFNKAFQAYDTIEGARCQTASKNRSQREAAEEAVRRVGLNQIAEVSPGMVCPCGGKRDVFPAPECPEGGRKKDG